MTSTAPDHSETSAEHLPWDLIDAGADEVDADGDVSSEQPGGAGQARPSLTGPGNGLPAVTHSPATTRSGGWTLPLLCVGIALIACCVLIPQVDANRRVAYERQMLQADLANFEHQISVNREFLKRVADDPTLARRLAERQMKVIPEGSRILELTHEHQGMSPFQLLSIEPAAPMPPYKQIGGTLASLCYEPHSRLYLIGISLAMIASGLVLGYGPEKV